jgi:hypothetical protein
MNVIYLIYFRQRLKIVCNLNYTYKLWRYKIEEKLHLGVRELQSRKPRIRS